MCLKGLPVAGAMAILMLIILIPRCGRDVPESDIVAQVGNSVLGISEMKQRMALEGLSTDRESEFVDRWINKELLFQEAKRQKFDANSPELEWELDLVRKEHAIQKLLDRTYLEKIQVTEDEIQSYYDKNRETFVVADGEEEVRALHILIKTRSEADLAQQEIAAGKSFEEVARERSTDMFKDTGGDMGFFRPDDVIPEISRNAFRLPEGRVSQVFSSRYGYHILKVLKKYSAGNIKDLTDMRNEILQRLRIRKEGAIYYELLFRLDKEFNVVRKIPKNEENIQESMSTNTQQ